MSQRNYLEALKKGMVLFDGAMGTLLYDRGVFLNRCFEEINLSRPEMIEEVYREYKEAGAQVLTTNTYGANEVKLKGYNLKDKLKEVNQQAVQLARRVAGDELLVAGSVGPVQEALTPEDQAEALKSQIEILAEEGVDLILFETFSSVDDLIAVAEMTRKLTDLPLQAQFTLPPEAPREIARRGRDMAQRLDRCRAIDVLGLNCNLGPADMLEVYTAIKDFVKKPFGIMPNAGHPRMIDGRQIYLSTPEYFAEYALRFLDGGVSFLGGCCGTTPEHIHKMALAVSTLGQNEHKEKNTGKLKRLQSQGENRQAEIPLAERSSLGEKLARGEWVSTVEMVSPLGPDMSRMLEKIGQLREGGVKYINIPDGPRASSRMSALLTSLEIQKHYPDLEVIPHFCARDRNLIALQSDLLGSWNAGIRDVLLVTGDPPKVGKYPDVTGVFDTDAIGMTALASNLNQGIDLGGDPVRPATGFVKGCGLNPAAAFPQRELERAFEKAEAGADFFITQPVYDAEILQDFLEKVKPAGLPVLLGMWPLASYRNAMFLHKEVPGVTIPDNILERMKKHEDKEEAREDGIAIAREIIAAMKPWIQGVQVSPPFGRVQTALDVIRRD